MSTLAHILGDWGLGGQLLGGALSAFPVVGEKVVKAIHGVGAGALENIAKAGEGTDLEWFASGDQAGEDGSGPPAVIPPRPDSFLRR